MPAATLIHLCRVRMCHMWCRCGCCGWLLASSVSCHASPQKATQPPASHCSTARPRATQAGGWQDSARGSSRQTDFASHQLPLRPWRHCRASFQVVESAHCSNQSVKETACRHWTWGSQIKVVGCAQVCAVTLYRGFVFACVV